MRKLLLMSAGGAVGYVFGAKAGTTRYEALKSTATGVQERVPEFTQKLRDMRGKGEAALDDVSNKVADLRSTSSELSKNATPIDPVVVDKPVAQGAK